MKSSMPRDPATDHLLSPANAALLVIDFGPKQVLNVQSIALNRMLNNAAALIKTAKLFDLPIVLSTVLAAATGATIPALRALMPDAEPIDRSSINAWQDARFHEAVEATGRRKLLIAALWTEACLLMPTLDALQEGYEVYPVADAVGGTSVESHMWAMERMVHAGAKPTTWVAIACQLQRDWANESTAAGFARLLEEHLGAFAATGNLDPPTPKP
jgi:nicotinamidase-related amidase